MRSLGLQVVLVAVILAGLSASARTEGLTPIADIHANLGTLLGTSVTVEGVVYIPANYRGTLVSGYIQDGSGRGINLFGGSGSPWAALNTIGNKVQVTGEVAVFGGTTVELVNIGAVTMVSSGNAISPQQVSTQAANNANFEGTFIEISGTVLSSTPTGTTAINYTVNDGSGSIVVRVVNTLNVAQIANGTMIFARGAGTNFQGTYQIIVGRANDIGTGPALGIYADATGTSRRLCVDRNASATYYLVGVVPDFSPPGLTGAEFRIEVSNPSGYFFSYTAPDGASAFGNPFDLNAADSTNAAGVSVFFPSCQPPDLTRRVGDRVNFGTITVINLSGDSTELRVKKKFPPSDSAMPCPRFLSCDAPFFTPLCMGGGAVVSRTWLNGASCVLGAPSAPLNLTASFQGTNPETILLQWERPATGAIQGYNVYRSLNQGQFVKISTTLVAGIEYTDSPPPGGALCYQVGAVDSLAREGPRSGAACPPPPPLNLTAIFQGTDPETILLQWERPATGAIQGYNVYRSVSGGQYDRINPTPVTSMDYTDWQLPDGVLCYAVSAVDSFAQQGPKSSAVCPIPFSTETLQLDTHDATNDGAAGPVTTSQILDIRHWFLITVQGTASLWPASVWTAPSTVICGRPEKSPQQSSPGTVNGWVGADPEILFSVPLPPGGDCGQLESLGYPRHHGRFQVDLGTGFTHREPLGGAPLDPGPSHAYPILLRGDGARASFRWEEAQTSDDYGLLTIRIEQVNPSDVDPPVGSTPRLNNILMLGSVPNPFNPTTTIRYVLPRDTEVTVAVYDIRGRAIRRLFEGPQPGGYHSVIWDGRVDGGTRAPSGSYFAHVTTPLGSASERVTLVK